MSIAKAYNTSTSTNIPLDKNNPYLVMCYTYMLTWILDCIEDWSFASSEGDIVDWENGDTDKLVHIVNLLLCAEAEDDMILKALDAMQKVLKRQNVTAYDIEQLQTLSNNLGLLVYG